MTSNSQPTNQFDPGVLGALQGLDLKARYVVEGFLNGMHESPFHGMSVEFSEYRNYQPGDDLRRLDWRLFARSDHLYIKRNVDETNVRFYILCDTSASMAYRGSRSWASKIEAARVIAAALTWLLLKQKDAAGMLSCQGETGTSELVRPSQRSSQFGVILRQLEKLQPSGETGLGHLTRLASTLLHRRSVVLIFSDLLEPSENLLDGLKQLRFYGHDCLVFQVLDPDELDFPFQEPQTFVDMESSQRHVVSPIQARDTYLSRFQSFMDEHKKSLQKLEIPMAVISTGVSPWAALALFLAERRKMMS